MKFKSIFFRCLIILISIILIVTIFRISFGGTPIYFSSFLDIISNSNSVGLNFAFTDLTIYGNWGVFEFLRNFLNIFANIFSLLLFITTNLINVLIFILYFLRYIALGY